jgi:hypothetical protein
VRSKGKLPNQQWLHVAVTYDGSAKAAGVKLYLNGRMQELETDKDNLTGAILNREPLRIGPRTSDGKLDWLVDEVRFGQTKSGRRCSASTKKTTPSIISFRKRRWPRPGSAKRNSIPKFQPR